MTLAYRAPVKSGWISTSLHGDLLANFPAIESNNLYKYLRYSTSKMSTKTNTIEKNGKITSSSLKSIWTRAMTPKAEWPDKDEFLDVIYWARQVLGIILGIIWGIVPLKGFVGLLLFAGISCGIVYIYSLSFQSVDEEAYGGAWELVKEGFMTSFAGFLVTWIIFYTGLHFDSLTSTK